MKKTIGLLLLLALLLVPGHSYGQAILSAPNGAQTVTGLDDDVAVATTGSKYLKLGVLQQYMVGKNVIPIGRYSGDLNAAVAALDVAGNVGESFTIVIDQATTMSADIDLSSLTHVNAISIIFLDRPDAVLTLDNDDDLTIATGPAEYDFSHFAISGTASITFNYSVAARVSTYAQLADAIICTPSTIIVAAGIDLTANGGSTTTVPSGTQLTCTPGGVITTDADDKLVFGSGTSGPGLDVTWQCFDGPGVTIHVLSRFTAISPLMWGASNSSGDTVETRIDSSTELQNMFNAAARAVANSSDGMTIYFPEGRYDFNTPLVINGSGVTIVGASRDSSRLVFTPTDNNQTAITVNANAKGDNVPDTFTMNNILLQGNVGEYTGTIGLNLDHVKTSTFKMLYILYFTDGTGLYLNEENHHNTFQNCYFASNGSHVAGSGSNNGNIWIGCHYYGGATYGFDGTFVNANTFIGCDWEGYNNTILLRTQNTMLGCRMERNLNDAASLLQITGTSNRILKLIMTTTPSYIPADYIIIDGNNNEISVQGNFAGSYTGAPRHIVVFNGDNNVVELPYMGIFSDAKYGFTFEDNGSNNLIRGRSGYFSPDGSINVITGSAQNHILYSNDLDNAAAWDTSDATVDTENKLTFTSIDGYVSQSFTADRDYMSIWVSFDHAKSPLESDGVRAYVTVTSDNGTPGEPGDDQTTTSYISHDSTDYARFHRVFFPSLGATVTGSEGDIITVKFRPFAVATDCQYYIRNVMVSFDSPEPYTETLDSNDPTTLKYPVLSATIDPDALSESGACIKTATINGLSVGDEVIVTPPYDTQGILYSAYVSAANTLSIAFMRPADGGGGTIDLASGTWKIRRL